MRLLSLGLAGVLAAMTQSANAAPRVFNFENADFGTAEEVTFVDETTGRFELTVTATTIVERMFLQDLELDALVTASPDATFPGLGVNANLPGVDFGLGDLFDQIDNGISQDILHVDFATPYRVRRISFSGLGVLTAFSEAATIIATVNGNEVEVEVEGELFGNVPTVRVDRFFGPNAVVEGFKIRTSADPVPGLGQVATATRFRVTSVVIDAPEPGTVGLLMAGATGLFWLRRRRFTV